MTKQADHHNSIDVHNKKPEQTFLTPTSFELSIEHSKKNENEK